jgi:hypothetical protein
MSPQAGLYPPFRITESNGSMEESCAYMAAIALEVKSVVGIGGTVSGF